jgi:hypothetical protein
MNSQAQQVLDTLETVRVSLKQAPQVSDLHYQGHIYLQPVSEDRIQLISNLAAGLAFQVKGTLREKIPLKEGSKYFVSLYDICLHCHNKDFSVVSFNMVNLIKELYKYELSVSRYTLDNTILDSRYKDTLNLIFPKTKSEPQHA